MSVKAELPEHRELIRALHVAAFPDDTEADLVDRLRADGDVVISLVACDGSRVIGHVVFSAMSAPFRALAMAPVAVAQPHRRKGVAARLINEGIARARDEGWDGIFVVGEPQYYSRFGFSVKKAQRFASPYAGPYFMLLDLTEGGLAGKSGHVTHAPAFAALG